MAATVTLTGMTVIPAAARLVSTSSRARDLTQLASGVAVAAGSYRHLATLLRRIESAAMVARVVQVNGFLGHAPDAHPIWRPQPQQWTHYAAVGISHDGTWVCDPALRFILPWVASVVVEPAEVYLADWSHAHVF